MKTFKYLILILLTAVSVNGNSVQVPYKIMESFESGIPEGLYATGKSLTIDSKRMKHGQQSLKWEWSGNDQIVFNSPVGYHQQRLMTDFGSDQPNRHGGSENNPILESPRGFFLWVYNNRATQQRLRIQFGREDVVDCEFDFNLNFKGWRTIAIAYDRGDMRGVPKENMNRMTIHAPATGTGTFYLDMLGMSVPMNTRTVGPNPQLPYIDQHPRLVAQYPHLLYEYSKQTPTFQLEPLNAEVVADFRTIEKQVRDIYWPDSQKTSFTDAKFKKVKAKYDKFEIVREGDRIYGRPLIYQHIINDHFNELNLLKGKKFEGFMRWRHQFNYTLKDISDLYYYSDNPKIKKELEVMFINLFDYGVDQGFDVGAGLGWIHHYSYNIREYGPAMYIMRDVLKKHQRLDKAIEICRWFYSFNQVYNEKVVYDREGRVAGNADEIQGLLMPRLLSALILDDSSEKARDLKHFSSYYSNIITGYAQALDETFKPDGTIFHHAGHAFGYGGRAINGAVCTMYMLAGTSFAATEDAYFRIRKVTETYFYQLFTDKMLAPKAFANIRFSNYNLPSAFYPIPAILALSASQFDEEMATLFDDALFKYNKEDEYHSFWESKINERRKQSEHYDYSRSQIFPYTCVGINRSANDYMITVRGHSKYVYPFESWGTSFFAYPLFIANGYLDVSYPDSLDSNTPTLGTWFSGYDWHRWPGVTSVRLPYEKMMTDPGQVRDEGGEYLMSDQAFCGGVSSSYGCGVFAFQFKGHDKFNIQDFTGKKSYFFVGNKVICLGSDIQSKLEYDVETTLVQTSLNDSSVVTTTSWDGELDTIPYVHEITHTEPVWFMDNRNTGIYVNSIGDGANLILSRSTQTNPDHNGQKGVSGNFVTAYINHGKSPEKASYEYILVADTDAEKLEQLTSQMQSNQKPIHVIQKDRNAHVVQLNEERASAYAVYAEKGADFDEGLVRHVNKQSTFIVKEDADKLILSVADPDLNIYDGQDDLLPDGSRCELSIYEREWFFWPSRSTKLQLTLEGQWRIDSQPIEMETAENKYAKIISSNKDETIVEFECRDGLSAEVILIHDY